MLGAEADRIGDDNAIFGVLFGGSGGEAFTEGDRDGIPPPELDEDIDVDLWSIKVAPIIPGIGTSGTGFGDTEGLPPVPVIESFP